MGGRAPSPALPLSGCPVGHRGKEAGDDGVWQPARVIAWTPCLRKIMDKVHSRLSHLRYQEKEDGKTMSLYVHLFSVQNAVDAKQRGVRWKNIKKWQRRSFVYVRLHNIETTAVNHYSLKAFLSHFPLKDCSLRWEEKGEEIRDEMSKLQAVATDHTLISVIYWEVPLQFTK